MKGEKEGGTDSCTFKPDLTNERLPKSLHVFERQREVPLISVQVLVAGKFAIRKRRPRPRQAWIRELPERPAEALTPVCCHVSLETLGVSSWGGLRKAAASGTARHPGSLCTYVSGMCSVIRSQQSQISCC